VTPLPLSFFPPPTHPPRVSPPLRISFPPRRPLPSPPLPPPSSPPSSLTAALHLPPSPLLSRRRRTSVTPPPHLSAAVAALPSPGCRFLVSFSSSRCAGE
ncbi:hypothetical protein U1Q18_027473, partial [Sarracenia purpurea var. burkii]